MVLVWIKDVAIHVVSLSDAASDLIIKSLGLQVVCISSAIEVKEYEIQRTVGNTYKLEDIQTAKKIQDALNYCCVIRALMFQHI